MPEESFADANRPHKATPQVQVSGELGSATNPVRVLMPEGEREYLHRLRCPNGSPPEFERNGSGDIGPYGRILDFYSVKCGTVTTTVMMDMYHCIEEQRPLPGFDIVPEIRARDRSECE